MPASAMRFAEFTTAFELGLSDVHKDSLKKHPKTYTSWLREERVKRFYDTDWAVTGLGIMPEKTIGGEFATDRIEQGLEKQYRLKVYGLALVIQAYVLRWDLYGIFKGLPEQLAKTAIDRYNLVAWDVWNKAFSTSDTDYTTWKSEAICDSSHDRMDGGGTWRNRPTDNPGLSYVALQQAKIDLKKLVDERGRYTTGFTPRNALCSVELSWILQEILSARYRPDNAHQLPNQTGGISHDEMRHSSPYFTSTTAWFVTCDMSDYQIKMRLGDDPDLKSDDVPGTRNRMWTSEASFGIATYNSRGIWGSSGDGATSS